MSFRKSLPIDCRSAMPNTRKGMIDLIETTFAAKGNKWDSFEQQIFCADIGIFMDWRLAPDFVLKRIILSLADYRMILLMEQ